MSALTTARPIRSLASTSAAVVVTRNSAVFQQARATMTAIGAQRVMRMSPSQLLMSNFDVFWVIDGRVPAAADLVQRLIRSGRSAGMVLSSPSKVTFNGACIRMGVPVLLLSLLEVAKVADGISLSTREIEIVQLVAEGRTNSQIGNELGLSAQTVKSHLARMRRKAGAGDRAHLVLLAVRAGLIH